MERKSILKKKRQVEELSKLISQYKVVGVFRLTNLPAAYLQRAKAKLRGKALFKVAKATVIRRALEKAGLPKDFIERDEPYGIILTNDNPFKLFKDLKRSRGQAYAKPGQIAPSDITIPAGETPFPAGPMLSEFKQAGLDVKIDKGKIVIVKDKTVVKEGQPIPDNVARVLQKLDIKPFEIGVELLSAYRDGTIYPMDVLDVDEEAYRQDVINAFMSARNLSLNVVYPTKETMDLLIMKAFSEARNLAVNENLPEKEVIDMILAKAQAQASALSKVVGG